MRSAGAQATLLPAPPTGFIGAQHMWDLLFVVITLVVFALFFLLIKGVERIER